MVATIVRKESEAPSLTRDLLAHCILVNYLSLWLGYRSIQTRLIYMELVPGPTRSPSPVP